MESKIQLYNQMLSTLQELKSEFVEEASQTIQKRVLLMEEFRTALRIGLYSPVVNEVKTDLLFSEADRNRKELYYPVKDEETGGLAFCRVTNLEQITPGLGGVQNIEGPANRLRDENTLEAILVTGLAFDLHGGRMGFGGGLFDKCLSEFRGKRIALAYDFQIVSELPMALRQQKVDWIVTETRVIHCM